MNERIRKIAIETDAWCDQHYTGDPMYDIKWEQKFAELIVQECARIARATPAPVFEEHLKEQLGHTWDMAAIEAGREIIKHFGVE
jgi:hypothetical protein